jgi:hypothetical protein
MAENKTVPTDESVEQFLNAIADERRRQDSITLVQLMREATRLEPVVWRGSIVGFGNYHYRYASGREGDMILAGFAPRKAGLSIYNMGSLDPHDELLARLGKHSRSGGCLHITRLDAVDLPTLRTLIERSFQHMRQQAQSH